MAKEIARITPTSAISRREDAATHSALLEFQSPSLALVSKPVPRYATSSTYIVGAMVATLLVVAGTLPIDRVVTASGKVATRSSNMLVQPLDASIIRSINVRVGQHVHAGDLLAQLDPTLVAADLTDAKAQARSLQAEVSRLTAERFSKKYVSDGTTDGDHQAIIFAQDMADFDAKMENYRQKISSLQAALSGAEAQVPLYRDRAAYAATLLKSREDLERQGVGSKLNTLQARDSLAEVNRLLAAAQAAAISARRDRDAMVAERDDVIQQNNIQTSTALTDASRKLSDARQVLEKSQKHSDLVEIRADRDATVLAISNVSVGSVLTIADPFLTLVPDDAVLQVSGAIPATDVAFVRVGDPVVIKFDAYREREHGFAEGTVTAMAPDSQDNPASSNPGMGSAGPGVDPPHIGVAPLDLGSSVYRVTISIDALKLTNLPPDFRLQPGLGVEADVQVGKRTVLSYLFGRFIPALTEGMREP